MNIISYKSSFFISLSSKAIFSLSGIISLWIITKYCSMEEVGQYALAFIVLNIFYIFGRFGLPELLIYESSLNEKKDNLLKNIFLLSIVSSIICMVLLYFLATLISDLLKSDISQWLVLSVLVLPFMVFIDIFIKWYQSQQDIKNALVPSNIFRPILFMVFLEFFFNFSNLNHYMIIVISFFLSYFLVSIYYLYISKSKFINTDISLDFIKNLNLKHAYNNVFTLFLVAFVLSIDSFMVSYFYSDVEVAIYQVAIKVIMIATVFNMVIEPIFLSRIVYNKKNGYKDNIEKEHKIISGFGIIYWIVVFVIFTYLGEDVFSTFGSYTQSLEIFFIFMIGRIFDLTFGISASILNTYGYSKILLQNTILLLFVNFVLNYVLIKLIGLNGVAYATALVFVFQALLRSYQLKKYVQMNFYKLYIPVIPIVIFNLYYINRMF